MRGDVEHNIIRKKGDIAAVAQKVLSTVHSAMPKPHRPDPLKERPEHVAERELRVGQPSLPVRLKHHEPPLTERRPCTRPSELERPLYITILRNSASRTVEFVCAVGAQFGSEGGAPVKGARERANHAVHRARDACMPQVPLEQAAHGIAFAYKPEHAATGIPQPVKRPMRTQATSRPRPPDHLPRREESPLERPSIRGQRKGAGA